MDRLQFGQTACLAQLLEEKVETVAKRFVSRREEGAELAVRERRIDQYGIIVLQRIKGQVEGCIILIVPDLSLEEMGQEADRRMYEDKKLYYRKRGMPSSCIR